MSAKTARLDRVGFRRKEILDAGTRFNQCHRSGFRPGRGGDNLEDFGVDKFLMAIGELDSPYLRLFALSVVAAVLTSGCAVPTGTGDQTPPDPGMTLYPTPDRLNSFSPVPVEVPPTVAVAASTATAAEAVLAGAGGGRPPLCDPLLAPFIPGEAVSQNSAGAWIDSQGNELAGADVNGTLFAMSGLTQDKFKLDVQASGLGEEFRWWVEPVAKNGRPGWVGSSQDPFLDRPDSLPEDAELKINPLPDPGIAGKIVFGVSGGEVTAAVLRNGKTMRCFNPVTNEWFGPDSGTAAEETVPPPPVNTGTTATKTPNFSIEEELRTEMADGRRDKPETPIPPTAAPTAVVAPLTEAPTEAIIVPPEPFPTPTPEQYVEADGTVRPNWLPKLPEGWDYRYMGDAHWATGPLPYNPCPELPEEDWAIIDVEYNQEWAEVPWGENRYNCTANRERWTIGFELRYAPRPIPSP